MAEYLAYVPPSSAYESVGASFRVIPDQKSVFALVLPVIWLAWNRLWFWLAIYLALALSAGMAAEWTSNPFIGLLSILPGFYLFLEGNELLGRELERIGWKLVGLVQAAGKEDAELRFLAEHAEILRSTDQKSGHKTPPVAGYKPVAAIGIFPE